ncbi:MAG TPA: amidohydrolase family protein [Thermomicrobiales bacterium]|nr:amidohydrolase family protein [Thermomicrobiales bacterium]
MIDLSGLPIVDVHCHPFLNAGALTAEQFTNRAAFAGGNHPAHLEEGGVTIDERARAELQAVQRDTIYFRRLLLDLAAFFDVEPSLDSVLAARNQAVTDGYTDYVRRLWSHAGIERLVMDFGYPVPNLDLVAVRNELTVNIVPVFRIEPLIADLIGRDIGWDEFRRRYDDAIAEALTHGGYRGLKSIIAYRTGLDVSPLSRAPDQGYKALDGIRRGLGGGSMKLLRDHLLCRAMELAIEHDVPMQIHTGMGDYEVNLLLCRPAYLMELLRFPAFRACRVLLVHTGYPYHREAGYLANVLPRVYCDISEGVPFAGHGAGRILRELLEMAPISKVLYGSDGFTLPEINYTSAMLGRQALAEVLDELVADRMLAPADARPAGAMILGQNAERLYQLI